MTPSGLPAVSVASSSGASSSAVHPKKSKLDIIKGNFDYLLNLDPETVLEIKGTQGPIGKFYPVQAAASFFPDEFFERAKEVNAASLEPTHSIQVLKQMFKQGVPYAVRYWPHTIIEKAAMTGSEKLFRLPWKYGARPFTREESQTLLNKASQLFSQELERIRNHPPEGTPPEDWKKWMTILKLRMRARINRMNIIANGYERFHHFLYKLDKKARETRENNLLKEIEARENNLLKEIEAEKKASSAPTKSAKRKARQKAKQAQAPVLQSEPSRIASGKPGKTHRNPTVSSSLQPGGSGAPSPATVTSRENVQPQTIAAMLQAKIEPSTHHANPFSEKPVAPTYQDLAAALRSRNPEVADCPDDRLPFDTQAVSTWMKKRWDAVYAQVSDPESGVVIYSSES